MTPRPCDEKEEGDAAYGIVIGKGFTLGKRKCFALEHKTMTQLEIRKRLKYAGVTNEAQLRALSEAANIQGKTRVEKYLNDHREELGQISEEVQKKLFNLSFGFFKQ